MEVSLDHFSGHCLWSGRDQSFQNVTSKNDPVWNAANPFKFLSTVSTQRIRFSKSKVQNSIAEGFIAPAPGSPHPTRPRAPHGGCRRQDRTGPKVLLLGGSCGPRALPPRSSSRLLHRRAAGTALIARQRTWARDEAGTEHGLSCRSSGSAPGSAPARPRGLCRFPGRTAPSCSRRRSSISGTSFKNLLWKR